MPTKHSKFDTAHLFRYAIASADMYYSEWGIRDVFLTTDERGNFHIQGELMGGSTSTAIELCEIFLEYAMYCYTLHSLNQSRYSMKGFAHCLGRSTAEFLQKNTCLLESENPTDRVLTHLFRTMKARVSIEYSGTIEHLTVIDCPLEKAVTSSGLQNMELAHEGINIMCQSMVQAMIPKVSVQTSPTIHPEFAFSVLRPAFA